MSFRTLVRDTFKDFINWLDDTKNGQVDDRPVAKRSAAGLSPRAADFEDNHRGVNFTIYGATGGKIVSIRTLDERTDRWTASLYIITDKEDLGEELAQIITRESLSR